MKGGNNTSSSTKKNKRSHSNTQAERKRLHVSTPLNSSSKIEKGDSEDATRGETVYDAREEQLSRLEFEDPYEDEFESEELVEDSDIDSDDDSFDEDDMQGENQDDANTNDNARRLSEMDLVRRNGETEEDDDDDDMNVDENRVASKDKQNQPKIWRAGIDPIEEGEELQFDGSAYIMYHQMTSEWPCLSFDFVSDDLGQNRMRFPHTLYAVAGTQADSVNNNKIIAMKMSDLHKTQTKEKTEDDSSDDDSDNENEYDVTGKGKRDDEPILEHTSIPHRGCINRIRSMPHNPHIVATMADTGNVNLYNLEAAFHTFDIDKYGMFSEQSSSSNKTGLGKAAVNANGTSSSTDFTSIPINTSSKSNGPNFYTYKGHTTEGYALDWTPLSSAKNSSAVKLVTGDNSGKIHLWNIRESNFDVDNKAFTSHTSSVEDLQWSPSESSVFMSASADNTIRVWDIRNQKRTCMITVEAHEEDVNVISWNHLVNYLVVSGSDDGSFKVWDLRHIKSKTPVAHYKWHNGPITSIEWHPQDESVLTLSSADNQVSTWDLSVEEDEEEQAFNSNQKSQEDTLPPQLLFVHQGQSNIKELHYHRQIPGLLMTTAYDGFNVFKPAIGV